ncbi:hypothetical protein BUALT_Bualt14G0066700 [Buddleja alternifolia]|uniref:NB-ARC domain-containing protein n=1 Tax=Buddleja alternifolia TaxID=168488 RepID=A0AAV6WNU5_9LAMI|nr:hypothetical protein BUALT_Bualt14G0066700 [Buddleja alternifolia]
MVDATVSMVLKKLTPLVEKKVKEEVCLLLNAKDEAKTSRDDVLDEWEMENLKQQLEEESEDASRSSEDPWQKVSSFLESVCLCFKQTVQRRSIALDIKRINKRLDLVAQENENEFKFIPNIGGVSRDFKRIESTWFVEVSDIRGRDSDKKRLMSKLLSESSKNDTMWIPLKTSLESGEAGSRILVTTRNERFAKVMGSSDMNIHSLRPLSDSDCWSILSQIAFQNRRDSNLEMLEEIGLEIAKKCKGMPLAAKTMGGLLRFKSGVQEWQNVLKSEMWEEKVREGAHGGQRIVSGHDARHLSLMQSQDKTDFSFFPQLRSFFYKTIEVPPYLFNHLKRVRLLSLGELKNIPEEIGNLIHIKPTAIGAQ